MHLNPRVLVNKYKDLRSNDDWFVREKWTDFS